MCIRHSSYTIDRQSTDLYSARISFLELPSQRHETLLHPTSLPTGNHTVEPSEVSTLDLVTSSDCAIRGVHRRNKNSLHVKEAMLCFFSTLGPVLEETHSLLDTVSICSYSLTYMFILGCQTTYDHYVLITMSVRHILLARPPATN